MALTKKQKYGGLALLLGLGVATAIEWNAGSQNLASNEFEKIRELLSSPYLKKVKQGIFLWESVCPKVDDGFINDACLLACGGYSPQANPMMRLGDLLPLYKMTGESPMNGLTLTGPFAVFKGFEHAPYLICWLTARLQNNNVWVKQFGSVSFIVAGSSSALRELPENIGDFGASIEEILLEDFDDVSSLLDNITVFSNLERLRLGNCGIHKLPNDFIELANLEVLYLANNNLKSLPSFFGKLKKLIVLNLSRNSFITFPEGVTSLRNLESLTMSHNEIRTIPAQLTLLTHLQRLDLQNCLLEQIPTLSILYEVRTASFSLQGNPKLSFAQQATNSENLKDIIMANLGSFNRLIG